MTDKKKFKLEVKEVDEEEKKTEEETPDWALEGKEYVEILPSFKPRKNTVYSIKLLTYPKEVRKNTVYSIKLLTYPKEVTSGKMNFYTVEILKDGMKFSMIVNNSFRYHLTRLYKKHGDLLGKSILINKNDDGYFSLQLQQ